MSSPIRPFLNLLAFASIAGVLFWREHVWQTRLQQAPASHPAPALPKEVTTDLPAESMALRAEGEVLRKKLTDPECRLSTLTAEVQNLKKAAEAAKPPPTPGDLAQQLKTQRGLAFDPEPTWEPVAMDAILEKIKTQVEAQLPLPVAEARSRAAVAMGFTPEIFDYPAAAISLAQMSNGGFYDAGAKRFYYRAEASLERADGREAFIGGLSAALTSLKIGGSLPWAETSNDDAALAARSLANGDANTARVRFSIADQLNLNFDRNGAPASPPPNYSAPAYLAETWKFAQDRGSNFIEALAGKGGNAAIDAAYRRPPRSSAEILHPEELYFSNPPFEPLTINLPQAEIAGTAPLYQNTAGEFGTYLALHAWLTVEESAKASEGWAGDRYAIWPGEPGFGDHLYWKTAWRSPAEAREFFDYLRRVLMQRFSIPWRKEYDAIAGQFRVDDPRRIIRLTLSADGSSVTLSHATDPAFATALEAWAKS